MKTTEICPHAPVCSGCSDWKTPLSDQIGRKKQIVIDRLSAFLAKNPVTSESLESFSVGDGHHRVWFDLQFSEFGFGLFNQNHQIVPIKTCALMSEPLSLLFSKLQKIKAPQKKISARIRVSPEHRFGLWLDMSNLDVKELLIER